MKLPFCTEKCGKYVARHGVGLQWKKCGDWFSGSVSVEEYEIIVCLTHKNDERRSRKLHNMKAQVVVDIIERTCGTWWLHASTNSPSTFYSPRNTDKNFKKKIFRDSGLGTALFTRVKTGLQCKFVESLMWLANESRICPRNKVQGYDWKIQKIMHSWWKRGTVTPTSVVDDFVRQI